MQKKKIVFGILADTLKESGMGHFNRCFSIREKLPVQIVWFVSSSFDINKELFKNDIVYKYNKFIDDSNEWLKLANRFKLKGILIDSYNISLNTIEKINNSIFTIIICDTDRLPKCKNVIYPQPFKINIKNCGTNFCTIKSNFLNYRNKAKKNTDIKNMNVLVSFGAVDSKNISGKLLNLIIENINSFKFPINFIIILGRTNIHINNIKKKHELSKNYPDAKVNVKIVYNPKNIEKIIENCHIGIGAPGISHLERMYCGLPSILVSQNDTQRNLTRQWKTLGAALNVEDNLAKVIKYLVDFSFDVDYLNKVRNKGLNMVDGKGASRISNIILKELFE